MPKKYEIKNFNFKLVILLFTITIIGIMAIGSAKASVQSRQILGFVLGVFLMLFITFIDYSLILKFYYPIYGINMALLLFVQIFGESSNNAQRWVSIAGIRFQPSESAKILLILFFAQFIMKNKDKLNKFTTLLKGVLFLIPPLFLILKQPDLSTSIIILAVFCIIFFIGGISFKIVGSIIAVTIPLFIIILFMILSPNQDFKIIEDYQKERILAWIQPDKYALTTAYQQNNSITAIGSGKLWGKGLNNNEVGSVKNGNYISEPQTDFIFAIIGEEMGFFGSSIVIILLMLICLECFKVAGKAKDLAGTIICSGVGSVVCLQTFINVSVATGLMPNTGIPLPFVSYGLTNLVSLYIGMGFVLNVSLQKKNNRNTTSSFY